MKTTNDLFAALSILPQSDFMVKIQNKINGVAFFPGGNGTINDDINLNDKEYMIVGQDFDNEENYKKILADADRDINKNPTWRNTLKFLEEVDILPEKCFFTNAILGLRNTKKNTGKSPAFQDVEYLEACKEIFSKQVEFVKPKIIFVLGKNVALFLSTFSEELSAWGSIKSIKEMDDKKLQKKYVEIISGHKTHLIVLVHPSFRDVNVSRRKYDKYQGKEAETMMVKECLGK